MKRQALFFGIFTAASLAPPAFAADGAPGMVGLRWGKNAFNFEALPSGPQPLRNLSRLPNGKANAGRLVGDYRNPIFTPEAAAIVRQKGELAIAGGLSQCARPVPADRAAFHLRDAAHLSRCCRRGTAT